MALDQFEECLLQFGGQRAALAAADYAVVKLTDRRDFSSCACEKCFISNINVVACQSARAHFKPNVASQLNHRVARDADQGRSGFRLINHTVLDDEQVFARAFGDETIDVEQQSL